MVVPVAQRRLTVTSAPAEIGLTVPYRVRTYHRAPFTDSKGHHSQSSRSVDDVSGGGPLLRDFGSVHTGHPFGADLVVTFPKLN